MRTLLSTALLVFFFSATAFAQSSSTIEERMTGADFKAAGLDKLTPEELAKLNEWLQRSGQASIGAALPRVDRRGFEDVQDRTEISSRIVGEFRGWDGGTEFVLENGQVWKQVDIGRLSTPKLSNPAVTIRSGALGAWRLKIEGYNAFAQVRRIK